MAKTSDLSEAEIKKEIRRFTDRFEGGKSDGVTSEEYKEFQKQFMPLRFTLYERACKFAANLINIKVSNEKEAQLIEDLETCHLNTTPSGVTALSIIFPLLFMVFGSLFAFLFTVIFMGGEGTLFFISVFLLFGLMMIIPFSKMPSVMATNWRMRASNQMVLSIFYVVSYMRHTSNLELAIKFTSDHIAPPLAIDFKKIIWNVETSRHSSVKESLDHYLAHWKKYNSEFVESMHLITSSLYETNEPKRIKALEKALSLILESTYEKMLHFAQNLKSPITMLHMLGVILPVLGLVILPLVVSFMENAKWYHISVLYNVFLPVLVWYLGKVILSTRPMGYGQADITEINPELKKYSLLNFRFGSQEIILNPKWIGLTIIIIFVIIGISPLLIFMLTGSGENYFDYALLSRPNLHIAQINDINQVGEAKFTLLGYKIGRTGQRLGPFGLGSTVLSIAIPFGMAFGLSFYYKSSTKKLIKIRDKTRELENEFASALYQLGNRTGDGLPAEIAFARVAENMENTVSGNFFDLVSMNIATLGLGVEDSIFDRKYGAINKFPSALIESSMKVFIEAAKKGPSVASEALINISTYIKEMHRVDERLKDLMAEVTSSMQSQIRFLAPLISGIVIGLTSMITTILNTLGTQIASIASEGDAPMSGVAGLAEIFGDSIPTFYFQIVVGVYVVQITYLLTTLLNTIQNGYDPMNEKFLLGNYMFSSGVLYSMVALIVILIFNIIAAAVVGGLRF